MHTLLNTYRDSRRSFTKSQKEAILYWQQYRCARCHYPLDNRAVKFHHKKHWSQGGRTTIKNGIALCSICHDIIHHEERIWMADYKSWHFSESKRENMIKRVISWMCGR